MIPIPHPGRLVPRLWHLVRGTGSTPFAEGVLILGGVPMVLAGGVVAGVLGADFSRWLAIPAAVTGFILLVMLFEASLVAGGIVEAVFYAGVAFLLSGGVDRPHPAPSWILAGGVAAVFLGAAFLVWWRTRRKVS